MPQLTTRLIPFPKEQNPDLITLAGLMQDYITETGAGDGFDLKTFLFDWQQDTQYVMGYYDGAVLAGFAVARLEGERYNRGDMLTVETLYIKPEHRSVQAALDGLAAVKAFVSQHENINRTIIKCEPQHAVWFEKQGGKRAYVGVQL